MRRHPISLQRKRSRDAGRERENFSTDLHCQIANCSLIICVTNNKFGRRIRDEIGKLCICIGGIKWQIDSASLNTPCVQRQCIGQLWSLNNYPVAWPYPTRKEYVRHLGGSCDKVTIANVNAIVAREKHLVPLGMRGEEAIKKCVCHATFPLREVSKSPRSNPSTLREAAILPRSAKSSWFSSVLLRSYL